MKKIILFTLLLTLSISSFSQTTKHVSLQKGDYLKKARGQKTGAWLLIGGGFVLSATGIVVAIVDANKAVLNIYWGQEPKNVSNTGSILLVTGVVMMTGSIPLFIVSSKNKRKAMSMAFKNEMTPQIFKRSIVNSPVPSLTLKINL